MASVTLYFHILFACLWLGFQFFLPLVLVPILKNHPEKESLLLQVGLRLSFLGKYFLLFLFLTGMGNLYFKNLLFNPIEYYWEDPYGRLIGIKIVLYVLLIGLTWTHDRVSRSYFNLPSVQRKGRIWLIITGWNVLLLSLILFWIGMKLRSGI